MVNLKSQFGTMRLTTKGQEEGLGIMEDRKLYVSEYDQARLEEMILQARKQRYQGSRDLRELQALLDMAEIVPDGQLPKDVAMMGSVVRVRDLDTEREQTYTLVWPEQTDPDQGKVSILAPMGSALLGRREGSEFDWVIPEGVRHLKIMKVLSQPEGQGDPNDVANAVMDMNPLPYPERRRPLDEELAASDDTPTDVQTKWEGGFPSPHNEEEFEERAEEDHISEEEIEEGAKHVKDPREAAERGPEKSREKREAQKGISTEHIGEDDDVSQ